MNATAHRYGCHNRLPFAPIYKIGIRHVMAMGAIREVPVMQANTASKNCNYTNTALGQSDRGCTNCTHKASK